MSLAAAVRRWTGLSRVGKPRRRARPVRALLPLVDGAEALVVCVPEIGKALTARGRLRFRASGTCMDPWVQPGDLLHVEGRPVEAIAEGQVVVFGRGGRYFAHRVVSRGTDGGGAYLVTRPDNARAGDDGPVCGEDVVGVVARVERRGRLHEVGAGRPVWHARLGHAIRRGLRHHKHSGLGALDRGLARLQGLAVYQRVARRWLESRGRGLSWVIHVPLHAGQKCDLARALTPQQFAEVPLCPEPGGVDRFALSLVIGNGAVAAASASLVARRTCDEALRWEVAAQRVRARFRGTGIEAALLEQAERILSRRGFVMERP